MNAPKRFSIIILVAAVLLPIVLAAFNAYTDQSRVLHQDFENRYWNKGDGKPWPMFANRRYLKTLYLIRNPEKYDGWVMGSSRAGKMDTTLLGEHWFKYNFEFAMLQDHRQHLRALLARGIKPDHILLGIDRFNFYAPYPIGHVLYLPYPETFREHLELISFYLFKRPSGLDIDILTGQAYLEPYDGIRGSEGHWTETEQREREAKREAHEAKLLALPPFPATLDYTRLNLDEPLDSLREIKRLCEDNGIRLTVYMQPLHYKNYLAMNPDELDRIYSELAAITPFYDFSGLNDYTTDNFYWEEISHFAQPVNDRIARILTGQLPPEDGFGIWVTPDNVRSHRAAQRRAIARQVPGLLAYDKNIYLHPLLRTSSQ